MLLILQLFLRAMAVDVDVRLDRAARCTPSCVCNDASRVIACREIDLDNMAVRLDLAGETSARSICMSCFHRVKTAAAIERIVQSVPDLDIVDAEANGQRAVSLYRSIANGIVGLKTDHYYLVTAESQEGLLSKYGLVRLIQHDHAFRLSNEKTMLLPDLGSAIYLYFNTINESYMVNEILDGPAPIDLISVPEDYSTLLYWVFIGMSTVNVIFATFKGIRLVRAMLKRGECVSL